MTGICQITYEALVQAGEQITLARYGLSDLTVWARIDGGAVKELVEGIGQFDRKIIISNQEIAGSGSTNPPKRGDWVLFSDNTRCTIQSVDTATVGTEVVRHTLWLRGD
jgi:hypothetical protein